MIQCDPNLIGRLIDHDLDISVRSRSCCISFELTFCRLQQRRLKVQVVYPVILDCTYDVHPEYMPRLLCWLAPMIKGHKVSHSLT